jgi:hypothetical protein
MADPDSPSSVRKERPAPASPVRAISSVKVAAPASEKMICERCGAAEMYRMHAVWRCPACGFKTDCCGW